MRTRHLYYGVLSLLIILIMTNGCTPGNAEKTSDHMGSSSTRVTVIPATKGDIFISLSLTGMLMPVRDVKITSKIPGRVDKVHVEEGDSIKPGDILIELENEEAVLSVKQAEAAFISAQAHFTDMKRDYDRMKKLYEEESIPGQKWEKVQVGLQVTEAQTEQAQAGLALAQKQLANCTIRSPIAGIVTQRSVEPGEVVSPPMIPGTALLQIMKLDDIKTEVNVSEKRFSQIKLNQETIIRVDAIPGKAFHGKVTKIAPVIDPESKTFEIEIDIPNQNFELRSGMFARVTIVLERQTDTLLIPIKALLDNEKEKVVFVIEDDIARERIVRPGLSDGVYTEILSGLIKGEMVIVKGNTGMADGTKVSTIPAVSEGILSRGDKEI